jgi:hypothetical protein
MIRASRTETSWVRAEQRGGATLDDAHLELERWRAAVAQAAALPVP